MSEPARKQEPEAELSAEELAELRQALPLLRALKRLMKSPDVDDSPPVKRQPPSKEAFAIVEARRRKARRGT